MGQSPPAGTPGSAIPTGEAPGADHRPGDGTSRAEPTEPPARSLRALVLVPTYNERENIVPLLEKIFSLRIEGGTLEVLVVDDSSPDGTGRICAELAHTRWRQLHVLHRTAKRGRGSAGIEGLQHCLRQDVDYILEMDADFSHNPAYIPVFLSLARYFDVVVGSRFVEGGAQVDRHADREFVSLCANFLYRLILGMRLRDISGGFKCYRKDALMKVDFDDFFSDGYPVGMETLYRLYKAGCSFVEIPIIFPDRRFGSSKFNFREARNGLIVAVRLTRRFGSMGRLRRALRKILRLRQYGQPRLHVHGITDEEDESAR